jgi:hypothetical protein
MCGARFSNWGGTKSGLLAVRFFVVVAPQLPKSTVDSTEAVSSCLIFKGALPIVCGFVCESPDLTEFRAAYCENL